MPNRILKESICTSDSIDALSWFEEVFFYRLIVNCDDFGRLDARPKILKSKLFPLKEIREDQVVNTLYRLSLANIIIVYMYDERPYLQLRTWGNHQQIRNKRSRYPELSDSKEIDFTGFNEEKMTLHDFEILCNQLISSDCNCPRNPIQSESNPNPNLNPSTCSEPEAPELPSVINLPLNDNTEYGVTEDEVRIWKELYPAVDVMQELRNMKGWLLSNSTKRKTRRGTPRFITGWLGKQQNKGGSFQRVPPTQYQGNAGVVHQDRVRELVQEGNATVADNSGLEVRY